MIDPELKAFLEQMEARINGRVDARMDAITLLIESVNQSLGREMKDLHARVERLEHRVDRIETRLGVIEITLTGINRALDRNNKETGDLLAIQKAQQKAIDDLVARVQRLEGGERTH